jgi:hypothetical protein
MGPMELFFELQKNSNLKVSKNSWKISGWS